jgi:putative Mn2+ efflux pump MntP
MNGSFVLQGFLISLGAVLVHRIFPARWNYWVALVLLVVSGAGVIVVGLVPEDADAQVHRLGALAHLLAGNLVMILVGAMTLAGAAAQPFRMRATGWITLAAGSAGLLALLALGLSSLSALSTGEWIAGVVERLAAYPIPLWLTGTGVMILGMRAASE